MFICDRDKGLAKCSRDSFTAAFPRHCGIQLLGNVPGPSLASLPGGILAFWTIVKADREYEREAAFNVIKGLSPQAYDYLKK